MNTFRIRYIAPLLLTIFLGAPEMVFASTSEGTISSGTDIGYAWSENAGYVNFGLPAGNVRITDSAVTGYAWDSIYGWLNLGPIVVGGVDYGVKNTPEGRLSGYAWSAGAGWISFDGISINSSGRFTGKTAAATIYGRLTFDCPTYCNVQTDWRPSALRTISSVGVSGSFPYVAAAPIIYPPFEPVERITTISKSPFGAIKKPKGIDGFGAVPSSVIGTTPSSDSSAGHIPTTSVPQRLFDIAFAIERTALLRASDLVTRVSFVNFGNTPTAVSMEFSIVNKNGAVLYTSNESIIVQTENVFLKRYLDLELPTGAYQARLHTKYGENVEDDFSASFTVAQRTDYLKLDLPIWIWFTAIIVPPSIFLILYLIMHMKRNKRSNK